MESIHLGNSAVRSPRFWGPLSRERQLPQAPAAGHRIWMAGRERRAQGSIGRKRRAKSVVDAELNLADALTDVDGGSSQQRIIECNSATAEIQVIIFELDRPIFPECPLYAGTDSPAEPRLGGGEI